MKIQFRHISMTCFLLALARSTPTFAVDVLLADAYDASECKGDISFTIPVGVADVCIKAQENTTFMLFTCSSFTNSIFPIADCSGEPSGSQVLDDCNPLFGTTTGAPRCQTVPDNEVAIVYTGSGCTENGRLMDLRFNRATIIDACNRAGVDNVSYTLVVGDDDVLSLTTYSKSTECRGESQTTTIELETCKKVSGIVVGLAEDVFISIEAAVPGTKLGNNSLMRSTNRILTLVATMVVAVATLS